MLFLIKTLFTLLQPQVPFNNENMKVLARRIKTSLRHANLRMLLIAVMTRAPSLFQKNKNSLFIFVNVSPCSTVPNLPLVPESSPERKTKKATSDMRGIDGCGHVANFRLLKFPKKKRSEVRYRKMIYFKA